jgi:aerobic-type carbon monoxide dehydrogenase small subunit (CoxS/CutS family)
MIQLPVSVSPSNPFLTSRNHLRLTPPLFCADTLKEDESSSALMFLLQGASMPDAIAIEVNGKHYQVHYPPETPLLYVLRDELGFTGSKYGCGEGQCGSCTVLLGGQPRRSCQIPVSAAVGKPVTTIEGLEKDGHLHPVQQAFIDVGAFQCAYCTPGMIMSSVGLLQSNPNPSSDEIAQFLQGNICRCGTQPRITVAVLQAAKAMQERAR